MHAVKRTIEDQLKVVDRKVPERKEIFPVNPRLRLANEQAEECKTNENLHQRYLQIPARRAIVPNVSPL